MSTAIEIPRTLGVVSDTHGFALPDVLDAFRSAGVELILHAGDIGSPDVVSDLEKVAPVVAVAGNGDENLYHRYPWDLRLYLGERRILLCHWYDNFGRIHPVYARTVQDWEPDVVVSGHTHEAGVERKGATLFVNPGYAGPPEGPRERSVALLELEPVRARIVPLEVQGG
jgi:putative phosphoesterase